MVKFEFEIGEKVWDGLLEKPVTVIGRSFSYHQGRKGLRDNSGVNVGLFGYWVDDSYLDGGRHPWEISKLPQEHKQSKIGRRLR